MYIPNTISLHTLKWSKCWILCELFLNQKQKRIFPSSFSNDLKYKPKCSRMSCKSQKSPPSTTAPLPPHPLCSCQNGLLGDSSTTRSSSGSEPLHMLFLLDPLLPDSLWLVLHCLQVSAYMVPCLWLSPWPHPNPHGISYSPYPISFSSQHLPPEILYIYLIFAFYYLSPHTRMQAPWGQELCFIHWCIHST